MLVAASLALAVMTALPLMADSGTSSTTVTADRTSYNSTYDQIEYTVEVTGAALNLKDFHVLGRENTPIGGIPLDPDDDTANGGEDGPWEQHASSGSSSGYHWYRGDDTETETTRVFVVLVPKAKVEKDANACLTNDGEQNAPDDVTDLAVIGLVSSVGADD